MNTIYLAHHGILGQKWGKKNGPPYPLEATDHSAAERKAGWRKSLKSTSGRKLAKSSSDKSVETHRRGLTSGQKRAILIGTGLIASGLVTYGVYKSGMLDSKLISRGEDISESLGQSAVYRQNVSELLNKSLADLETGVNGSIASNARDGKHALERLRDAASDQLQNLKDSKTQYEGSFNVLEDAKKAGFKLKDSVSDQFDDARIVSKWYERGDISQRHNCTRSSVAYLMRRFGLDVESQRISSDRPDGADVISLLKVFKGSIPEVVDVSTANTSIEARASMMKEIKELYRDSPRAFGLMLTGVGPKGAGGGHAMVFEKHGDSVSLIDAQSGGVSKIPAIFDHIVNGGFSSKLILVRVDDCGVDTNLLSRYVKNRE